MSQSTRKRVLVTIVAVVALLGIGAVGFVIPKIFGADDASASSGVANAAPVVVTTTQTAPPSVSYAPRSTTPPTVNSSAPPEYQQPSVKPTTQAPRTSAPAKKPTMTMSFYGQLSLSMDPTWKVLNKTDTSTYIGSTDPAKMCHSLEESCPSLRIFNYQTNAAEVANGYADCDAAPVPSGTQLVGGVTADYFVAKPCHEVSMELLPDEHRIYVIPGKLVLVVVLVDGQTLDNLGAVLAGAAW